ncbi:hypothetical protein NRIC_29270 [Enterococcus florum]|uniref:Transcriptional regulator n=1 Tax=Enterococcus florum TaxID=2480627 RepID=A0A4P5PBE3_9ENTE|nr:transcriptional regulator [Enterococcus florum]GCF95036.1 hypothetical protein NRIC_29270 [Enterococcus florum]
MEKWKRNYLKGILADYPHMEEYIKEYEAKLLYSRAKNDGTEEILLTISDDRRLRSLEKNYLTIKECLEHSTPEVRKIIQLLYLSPRTKTDLNLTADRVFLSTRQVTRLRNQFFEELAEKLGI